MDEHTPTAPLEAPDEPISLVRAAALSGVSVHTLRHQAKRGRLQVKRLGWMQYTTRALLHAYLTGRQDAFRKAAPLPTGYVAPGQGPYRGKRVKIGFRNRTT